MGADALMSVGLEVIDQVAFARAGLEESRVRLEMRQQRQGRMQWRRVKILRPALER
jgi:hypothetical protein